jgi:purine catabolism regulator
MKPDYILTVNDVMRQPLFHNAHVVAGQKGLHRKIRWVHVLEVSDFEMLLHGEEMILSTGIGLGNFSVTSYMEKLVENRISCLCIELGHFFSSISEEMIQIANEHDLPLIVFHEMVRFIDITQELHSLIINRHYKMLESLESISREFHRLTLSSQGTSHILKLLQKSSNAQVAYIPFQGTPVFIPALSVADQQKLMKCAHASEDWTTRLQNDEGPVLHIEEDTTYLLQPVGAMGQTWANLILAFRDRDPLEYDSLVLDRASLALSQDLLRKKYMDERKLHSENLWVDDLINGRIKTEEQVKSLVGSRFKVVGELHYRVCVIEVNTMEAYSSDEEWEAMRLHLALLVRSAFQKSAFYPLMTAKNNQLVVVAIDYSAGKNQKERLSSIFNVIGAKAADKKVQQMKFGAGRSYKKFTDAPGSFKEAQGVLTISHLTQTLLGPFYEDIGIYRLLLHQENDAAIKLFIDDYLGPLIQYDRTKRSGLIHTLKVYFDNLGSKQVASQELFVTRQTLYHRMNKIHELLGEDLLVPERRLSIEVALRAYQMLYPEECSKH